MLDHDELLPEELANPSLIQELRTTYQVTPVEQRVLARVHERLAQYSYSLPVDEYAREREHTSVNAGYDFRPLQLVSPIPVLEKPGKTRRRWLRNLNAIAGVLFLVLLVGSLVFAFTATRRTSTGSADPHTSTGGGIRIVLVPEESSSVFSQQQVQAEATILTHRFDNAGLRGSSVHVQMIHGQLYFQVNLPHFGNNEQQTTHILLETGVLAFWNTGPSRNQNAILAQDTTLRPAQYIQYNPGGQPRFTNADFDPRAFSVVYDPQTGRPQIMGETKGSAIVRFRQFTAQYVNYGLTMTLDGKVLSSANIQSTINGPFVIIGNYTQQQARAIVSVLKYPPLPFALKQVK